MRRSCVALLHEERERERDVLTTRNVKTETVFELLYEREGNGEMR